mmetsp:Transcript_13769/g.43334  ORF Transcript_13769/g.43334 Transcript_13769/m.43334 type:complete len:320 (+) Transcript_13769:118-1077(+)
MHRVIRASEEACSTSCFRNDSVPRTMVKADSAASSTSLGHSSNALCLCGGTKNATSGPIRSGDFASLCAARRSTDDPPRFARICKARRCAVTRRGADSSCPSTTLYSCFASSVVVTRSMSSLRTGPPSSVAAASASQTRSFVVTAAANSAAASEPLPPSDAMGQVNSVSISAGVIDAATVVLARALKREKAASEMGGSGECTSSASTSRWPGFFMRSIAVVAGEPVLRTRSFASVRKVSCTAGSALRRRPRSMADVSRRPCTRLARMSLPCVVSREPATSKRPANPGALLMIRAERLSRASAGLGAPRSRAMSLRTSGG